LPKLGGFSSVGKEKSSVLKFFYNFSSLTFTSRDAFKVFS